MKKLRDIPVSRKLVLIIIITTSTALLLIAAAFSAYDYSSSRRDSLEHVATLGRIVAGNSTAAVAFNDAKAAAEVLNTLQEEPEVQTGCTYDSSGHLLAEYHRRAGEKCPELTAKTETAEFTSEGAVYSQPILLNQTAVGFTYLESNLSRMQIRRTRFTAIAIVFLLASLAVGILLGAILRRWIARPIVELASVMQKVSKSHDYSLRAASKGSDEIGELVTGFNRMLGEIQDKQAQLEYQALNDDLTGLPNRRLLADRLSQALAVAKRQQSIVALLYLDLDEFKLVNDTLGHSVGDLLLRQVADRLRRRVRASDTLARIGGDEFTVVAAHIRSADEAVLIAKDLLAELAMPFVIKGHELAITASIGISLYPQDAVEAEQIIQQADTAMYVAKGTGKNQFKFFTAEFGDAVRERLELENQLRGALERGELFIHYQPEFDVLTRRLMRFEALARWQHPTLGSISPTKFIPIAEENGLIVPIGLWIMEQACIEAVKWQELSADGVQLAVNVSTVQFLREDFADSVAGVLMRTGLDPGLLQLELTESVLMTGYSDSAAKMSQLRSLGVSLAIDDFGTGYSSLSYLQRLPFDYLKIDRSFLAGTNSSRDPQAMMRSLVDLAHHFNMTVIVEGVETTEHLSLIQEIGCDQIQGFILGRPTANPRQYLSDGEFRASLTISI